MTLDRPRAAPGLFALVGAAFLLHWTLADPGYGESSSQDEWPHVLGFSAAIIVLAAALPAFARLAGGRAAARFAPIPAAGATLSSAANICEDGLQMGWAFWVFVAGTGALLAGLVVLAAAIALGLPWPRRIAALVPAGTAAGLVLYVGAGGPVMAATWLGAAGFALAARER